MTFPKNGIFFGNAFTRTKRSLSCIMLVMAISAVAQPSSSPAPMLDSVGRPLQHGVEYYINPAITDSGGCFTLINRNGSCPFYVGQENGSRSPCHFHTFRGGRDSD